MKKENTGKLYLRWIGNLILAILDAAILLPMGVALIVGFCVGRGQYQKAAMQVILVELRELPLNMKTKVDAALANIATGVL
jgi:hypothetical protein